MTTVRFLVTCEHASPAIPQSCSELLKDYYDQAETHQVYDPGAASVADEIASRLSAPILKGSFTRLAIDLNRSLGNDAQFSPPVFLADERLKASLISDHYIPFRTQTIDTIDQILASEDTTLIHLSVHSFTKVFKGQRRSVDLGILFDPERSSESKLSKRWIKALASVLPEHKVEANQPYLGSDDGHVTALRRLYPQDKYVGIEIELSQDLDLDPDSESWARILCKSLLRALKD